MTTFTAADLKTFAGFAAALDDLHLTQARFARLTGVHPTTVSRWATGGLPIPGWVPSWLDMCRRAGVPDHTTDPA